MKIYATTKFIIIGIIIFIIIMIVTYIFKIIEAGNNEPFWVKPAHVHNTGTLYLGDQHCLVRNSVGFCFCFSFHMCLSLNPLSIIIAQLYIQDRLGLGLKHQLLFQTFFRNPHKNWRRNNGIMLQFELTFSAIISTGLSF